MVKGCISKICARFKEVIYPAYRQGKATLFKTDKRNKIVKESDVEYNGDLVHME